MDETQKLREMLDDAAIKWVDNSNSIILKTQNGINATLWSVIYGIGTYGYHYGLLEVWDYSDATPSGNLTAKQAFDYIQRAIGK